MLQALVYNDIWSLLHKYSYPGKITATFHQYTDGDSALQRKYYKLVLASSTLKFNDPSIISDMNRTDVFDHVFSSYPHLLSECTKECCICVLFSTIFDISAKILLHLYDHHCTCESERDDVIRVLVRSVFRDKDLRAVKPLSRLQNWLETVPDIVDSALKGVRDRPAHKILKTALPFVKWFLKLQKPTVSETDREKFIQRSGVYAITHNDQQLLDWFAESEHIELIKLKLQEWPVWRGIVSRNILSVNTLEFLKRIDSLEYIRRTFDINEHSIVNKTDEIRWVLNEFKCEDLVIKYSDDAFWHALSLGFYETLDLLPDPSNCSTLFDNCDPIYNPHIVFRYERHATVCRMFSDPELKNWLQRRFPQTKDVSVTTAHSLMNQGDLVYPFLRSCLIRNDPVALHHILSRLSSTGTFKRKYEIDLLENILEYIRDVYVLGAKRDPFTVLAICRCVKHHSKSIKQSPQKINPTKIHQYWFAVVNTECVIKLAHWFSVEYDTEILCPVRIARENNVELLIYYFSKKDTRTTWDAQVEIENRFRKNLGMRKNSWNRIIPIVSDSYEYSDVVEYDKPKNVMICMLTQASSDAFDWIVSNQETILKSKDIKNDYSKHYKRGPKNILQLLVWSYRKNPKVKEFLKYKPKQ